MLWLLAQLSAAAAGPIDPLDVVGTWDFSMTVAASTCPSTSVGSLSTGELTFRFNQGVLEATNPAGGYFVGTLTDGPVPTVQLRFQGWSAFLAEYRVTGPGIMEGRTVSAGETLNPNDPRCVEIVDVRLRRR